MTRQEQRALFLLLGIVVAGVAIHQWRGAPQGADLIIDAEGGEVLYEAERRATDQPSEAAVALVDLNTASMTELPGIGEGRAGSILEDRESNGPFRSVDDITRVPGIGEGILARIRPHATVSGVAPPEPAPAVPEAISPSEPPAPAVVPVPVAPGLINVNTATHAELMRLPGIGEVRARLIIEHRQTHGPYRRAEDLQEIHGIGPGTVGQVRTLITF